MSRRALLLTLLAVSAGALLPARAEQVVVTGVAGQVLFGAGAVPWKLVKAGERFGAGTFSAGSNGILYLSTFDGSELRLSESGTLHYDATDGVCRMKQMPGKRSTFHLLAGKLQVNIRYSATPPHCYDIVLAKAQAAMSQGQCVICMHGSGTYIFVARGNMMVTSNPPDGSPLEEPETPLYGALPNAAPAGLHPIQQDKGRMLIGNGQVGSIDVNGGVNVRPLSGVAAATQTCLLAGFNPKVADSGGKKAGFSPDASSTPTVVIPPGDTNSPPSNPPGLPVRRFVVSPTQ